MNCPLCLTPMEPDRRYTKEDAAKCPGCGYQVLAPKGYMEDALRKCAGPGCEEPLPPDEAGRPREFHARRCRQAAYRLRRNAEGIAEAG